MSMPKLAFDLSDFTADEQAIINRAMFKGALRATRPFRRTKNLFEAKVNYVWRMLCFDYVARAPHCCLPMLADWDIGCQLPRQHDAQRQVVSELDALIKRVEATLPLTAQAGVMRWGRALGAF